MHVFLETDRLILRRFTQEDVDDHVEYALDRAEWELQGRE
jgi:hypothetical protein